MMFLPLLESATLHNAATLPHIYIVERTPKKKLTYEQAKCLSDYYHERAYAVNIQVSIGKAYPEDVQALEAKSLAFFKRQCELYDGEKLPVIEIATAPTDDSIEGLYEDTSQSVFLWGNGNLNPNDDYLERFIQPLYDDMYGDY